MVPDRSSSSACVPLPHRRRRLPGFARKALRWGLVGGACCFVSWCGLTAASAGTAQAATTDGQGLTAAVAEHKPVEKLVGHVGDVGAAAEGAVTDLTRVPQSADEDVAAVADVDERGTAAVDDAKSVGGVRKLTEKVDRLTRLATSIGTTRTPAPDGDGDTSVTSTSVPATKVDVPAGVEAPTDTVTETSPDASTQRAQARDASAQPDGTHRSGPGPDHAGTHVRGMDDALDTAVSHDGEDSDTPVVPLDPRAVTSSTTSSSSSGGSAFDGGSGTRVLAFHLPDVARSVTVPALDGVQVPWSSAGKPRVSPD